MKAQATKPAAVAVVIVALKPQVAAITKAFGAVESAQSKLGDAVLAAAPAVKPDQIAGFCSMVHTALTAKCPEKAGSIKAQVTYIRRVLTAIVVDKIDVQPGQSLRGLYDALPKAATGANTHGAKLPNPGKTATTEESGKIVTLTKAEKRAIDINAAITTLFGTCNPDLVQAMEYAASNSGLFMSWASASVKASQLRELEKLAAQKPAKVAPVAKPAKASRARKSA